MTKRSNKIPKDAVLLIPEPEDDNAPAPYGVVPSYYNPKQLLALLDQHRHSTDAIHFIADMLETGDAESDGFAHLLRDHHAAPTAIGEIIEYARKKCTSNKAEKPL